MSKPFITGKMLESILESQNKRQLTVKVDQDLWDRFEDAKKDFEKQFKKEILLMDAVALGMGMFCDKYGKKGRKNKEE